jgi:FAD/FMN-containing dehydrogenase
VVTPSDSDFEAVASGGQWNHLRPARVPDVIARVADEQDVLEAVRFAKASKLKVAVRGGGHNWCNPALRNGGMLIDLADLDEIVSIDAETMTAVVQPILSNREVQAALNAHGLSYPTGHCPQVKLSGYLLGGGMAWNQGVWGEGLGSVRAIELVTPDGELITASEDENSDYFWAARGAGSGLFAVAVRYHLKLYALPEAIWTCGYHYAIDDLDAVAGWLAGIAGELSNQVELTVFLLHAPPELADNSVNGKIGLVTATAFADSEPEARSVLAPLGACPVATPLAESAPQPTTFAELFDLSGSMWPERQRSQVDAMFFDANPAQLVKAAREHFPDTPSETTLILFSIYTGPNVPAPLPDAAFSMSAKVYGGPWTQWTDPAGDDANIAWHSGCVDLLEPLSVGHYIGESDTVGHPEFAERSFSPSSWKKLAELRAKYDPEGVFFSFSEGF